MDKKITEVTLGEVRKSVEDTTVLQAAIFGVSVYVFVWSQRVLRRRRIEDQRRR